MMSSNDRTRLTGAFLGNILARMGNDDAPAEDAPEEEPRNETPGEESRSEEADWYPYDDSSLNGDSLEDEDARLAEEEEFEGEGLEGGEGFGLGLVG